MAGAKEGIIWSAIERFSVQGSQFIISLIIARLISPADFGLIAMLTIFLSLAQVFIDSGFGSALIQRKDRNNEDFSTVFFFNLGISIIIYIILYFAAPYIALFYHIPELSLITRIVGINIIIIALYTIQKIIYRISLNFKKIAIISLIGMLLSGILGIIIAYKGFGVWSLVIQALVNNVILVFLFWTTTKWHPEMIFSIKSFKRLFSFGSKLLFSNILNTIFLNLYSLVIGRYYNPTDVGYYNRASTISQHPPGTLITIITNVIYPLQCEHQDDKNWMIKTFPSLLSISCYVVFPVMILLAISAKPFVLVILSEKWIETSPLISILSVAYMWIAIGVLNNSLVNSKGRSDYCLKAEIIKKIIAVVILIITIPFGIIWLCIGLLIYNIVDVCIIIWFTKKIYPLGYKVQFRSISPVLLLSIISGVMAYSLNYFVHNEWLLLVLEYIVFTTSYFFGSKLGKFKEYLFIINALKKNKTENKTIS